MAGSSDEERLNALAAKLKQAEQATKVEEPPHAEMSGMSAVWRISSDLLGGIIVGSVLGIALDRWLETTPWLFLLCFMLGTAAGGMMVYRATAFDSRQQDANDSEDPHKEK